MSVTPNDPTPAAFTDPLNLCSCIYARRQRSSHVINTIIDVNYQFTRNAFKGAPCKSLNLWSSFIIHKSSHVKLGNRCAYLYIYVHSDRESQIQNEQ